MAQDRKIKGSSNEFHYVAIFLSLAWFQSLIGNILGKKSRLHPTEEVRQHKAQFQCYNSYQRHYL